MRHETVENNIVNQKCQIYFLIWLRKVFTYACLSNQNQAALIVRHTAAFIVIIMCLFYELPYFNQVNCVARISLCYAETYSHPFLLLQ